MLFGSQMELKTFFAINRKREETRYTRLKSPLLLSCEKVIQIKGYSSSKRRSKKKWKKKNAEFFRNAARKGRGWPIETMETLEAIYQVRKQIRLGEENVDWKEMEEKMADLVRKNHNHAMQSELPLVTAKSSQAAASCARVCATAKMAIKEQKEGS